MSYWPGTKIIKSTNNAFDWRQDTSKITSTKFWKQSERATQTMAGTGGDPLKQFTIYSKAKPSKPNENLRNQDHTSTAAR